jgi:uncharacterized metal-binding protein YceD (DUF177 family)
MPRPVAEQAPEFSRPVEVDQVGAEGEEFDIEADPNERAALARRFGLLALDSLQANLTVAPVSRRLFRVSGRLVAAVVQRCVVTLEPVAGRIEEPFSALFGEGGPGLKALVSASEEEDQPEPLQGGRIDVGEVVAQHMALALDPYPRCPGAVLPEEYAEGAAETPAGPFAKLASLRHKDKS